MFRYSSSRPASAGGELRSVPAARPFPGGPRRVTEHRCRNNSCRTPLPLRPTGRPRSYCSDRCRRQSVHFSSRSPDWTTPPRCVRTFGARVPFPLGPGGTPDYAALPGYYTRDDDGLAQNWTGLVFVNPPYGREIAAWVRKAWESAQQSAEVVVLLLP